MASLQKYKNQTSFYHQNYLPNKIFLLHKEAGSRGAAHVSTMECKLIAGMPL